MIFSCHNLIPIKKTPYSHTVTQIVETEIFQHFHVPIANYFSQLLLSCEYDSLDTTKHLGYYIVLYENVPRINDDSLHTRVANKPQELYQPTEKYSLRSKINDEIYTH